MPPLIDDDEKETIAWNIVPMMPDMPPLIDDDEKETIAWHIVPMMHNVAWLSCQVLRYAYRVKVIIIVHMVG